MKNELTIDRLANGGYGVGSVDGLVCFVPYALPGDILNITIAKKTKNLIWGEIEEIIEPSPHRVSPECPYFAQCGGCTWLNFSYPAQAQWKQRIVRDCFQRIAGTDVEPDWIDDPSLRIGYRTRAEFHCDGKAWGFHARRTRDVVPIEKCLLCHDNLNAAFNKIRDTKTRGSVEITVNPETDEALLWIKSPTQEQRKLFPMANNSNYKGLRHSFLFDGTLIVNGCFSQSSLLLNRILRKVVHAAIGNADKILDLYCGNGNLSIGIDSASKIVGIDHNKSSIKAANASGKGGYIYGGEKSFRKIITDDKWDVIILDPPRTGAKTIISDIATSKTGTIIYVSCDPATLARDAKALAGHGWDIAKATVVDMFPNTSHIETVCIFERTPNPQSV